MIDILKLKERYLNLFPDAKDVPVTLGNENEKILDEIERILEIKLPEDFRQISSFYNGDLLGSICIFDVNYKVNSLNIVEETIKHRKGINLPNKYVTLAEPPESFIVMDTENSSSVIWCDAIDAERLEDKVFNSPPKIWNTYAEFFENLLEEEEEEERKY